VRVLLIDWKRKPKKKKLLEVGNSKLKEKKHNRFGSQEPFTSSHLPREWQQKKKNGPWNNNNKIEIWTKSLKQFYAFFASYENHYSNVSDFQFKGTKDPYLPTYC
jgi:hypothetical protein